MNNVIDLMRAMCQNNVSTEQMGVTESAHQLRNSEWVQWMFGENAKTGMGVLKSHQMYLYVYGEQLSDWVRPDVRIDVNDEADTVVWLYEINC